MDKEVVGSIVRNVLQVAGGVVVAKGVADEATVQVVIGALTSIAVAIWSLIAAKKAAKAKATVNAMA